MAVYRPYVPACIRCSKPYTPHGLGSGLRDFCSPACKRAEHRDNQRAYRARLTFYAECAVCGTGFLHREQSGRRARVYCSMACQRVGVSAKRKAWWARQKQVAA